MGPAVKLSVILSNGPLYSIQSLNLFDDKTFWRPSAVIKSSRSVSLDFSSICALFVREYNYYVFETPSDEAQENKLGNSLNITLFLYMNERIGDAHNHYHHQPAADHYWICPETYYSRSLLIFTTPIDLAWGHPPTFRLWTYIYQVRRSKNVNTSEAYQRYGGPIYWGKRCFFIFIRL